MVACAEHHHGGNLCLVSWQREQKGLETLYNLLRHASSDLLSMTSSHL